MLKNVIVPNFFLKFFGFWKFNEANGPDHWLYRVHRTVGVLVFVLGFSILELLHLLMMMMQSSDITKITDDLTHSMNHLLGMYKFFILKSQSNFIQDIHERSIEDDRITYERTEDFEKTKEMYFHDCTILNIKLISSCIIIASSFIVTGYVAPFIAGGETYLAADNVTLMTTAPLPYNTWVPFPEGLLPHYYFVFAYQGISMVDVSFMILCCDGMLIGVLNQISIQLRLLRYTVTTLHQRSNSILKKILPSPDCTSELEYKKALRVILNDELKKCIRHHQIILVMNHKISSRFSHIIFFQFSTTLIVLCVDLFQCLLRKGLSVDFLYMILYAITITFELYIYCVTGKEITRESELLPDAVFGAYWSNASPQFRTNLMLFLVRSQDPIELRALGLFPTNLVTYGDILKKAYSFFSVLKQMDYS